MEFTYTDWMIFSELCTTTGVPVPYSVTLTTTYAGSVYVITKDSYTTAMLAIMHALVERVYAD